MSDPQFQPIAELGDYALIRVSYGKGKKQYVYTGKITEKGRYMKSAIPEDFFKELVTKYLKREE